MIAFVNTAIQAGRVAAPVVLPIVKKVAIKTAISYGIGVGVRTATDVTFKVVADEVPWAKPEETDTAYDRKVRRYNKARFVARLTLRSMKREATPINLALHLIGGVGTAFNFPKMLKGTNLNFFQKFGIRAGHLLAVGGLTFLSVKSELLRMFSRSDEDEVTEEVMNAYEASVEHYANLSRKSHEAIRTALQEGKYSLLYTDTINCRIQSIRLQQDALQNELEELRNVVDDLEEVRDAAWRRRSEAKAEAKAQERVVRDVQTVSLDISEVKGRSNSHIKRYVGRLVNDLHESNVTQEEMDSTVKAMSQALLDSGVDQRRVDLFTNSFKLGVTAKSA